jgi:O-antigen/teichoic acid export membrane protein
VTESAKRQITSAAQEVPAAGLPTVLSVMAYAAAKIGPAIIMLAAIPFWARALGAKEYGLYSIMWAAALLSTSLAVGWIRQSTLRYAGQAVNAVEQLPRKAILICCGICTMPTLVVLAVQLKVGDYQHRLLTGIAVAIFTFLSAIYMIEQTKLQRDERGARFMSAEVARIAITVLLTAFVHILSPSSGAWVILLSFSVGTLAALRIVRGGLTRTVQISATNSSMALRKYWSFGWPIGIWLGLSAMFVYTDRLLISIIIGPEEAGVYAAVADMIVRGIAMLGFPLTMVSHPRIMRAFNSGDGMAALRINRRYTAYVLVSGLMITAAGSLLGPMVLKYVLGTIPANVFVIPLLVAGASIWQLALMTHKPLEMLNRTKIMIAFLAAATAVSTVASVTLMPLFGVVVPAAAFCFGAVLYATATVVLGKHLKPQILRANVDV